MNSLSGLVGWHRQTGPMAAVASHSPRTLLSFRACHSYQGVYQGVPHNRVLDCRASSAYAGLAGCRDEVVFGFPREILLALCDSSTR